MKTKTLVSLIALLALLSTFNPQLSAAPLGTAFTYQGKLEQAGNPANGNYDFKFTLFDTNTGGAAVAGPLTNAATSVENGYFMVTLDFGAAFDGNARWLEIGVRTNGGGEFTTLTPRQELTPTPYAIYSANAASAISVSGAVSAAQLTGTISSNNIGAGTITTAMLAAGAVGSNQLATAAVTTPALAEGAVTAAKVAKVSDWVALTITNPAPAANDAFGISVAAVGTDRVLIGARYDDRGAPDAGAAFLFTVSGNLLTIFTNPTPGSSDNFAFAVAAVGTDQVLIGAYNDGTGAAQAGAAYLFSTNGTLLTTITNPAPALLDSFGYSLAAVGTDRVLIGAFGDSSRVGAAYLFSTNGTLLTTVTNPTPATSDDFGWCVAAVGTDRVLIGANGDDTRAPDAGAAYLFSTNGVLLATLTSPTLAANCAFGTSVAAVGTDRLLIGAAGDDTGAPDAGAAYLFSAGADYTPGLVAEGVRVGSITAASLADGAVTATKIGGVLLTSQVPDLDAAKITNGTLADARLSTNVALLNANQVFAGSNRFAGALTLTNAANTVAGLFSGNGAGLTNIAFSALPAVPLTNNQSGIVLKGLTTVSNLSVSGTNFVNYLVVTNPPAFNGSGITNLNASQLASGTVPWGQLPGGLLTNNQSGVTLAGTFAGNGAGVTNVDLFTVNSRGAIGWTTNWGNFLLASSPAAGLDPGSVVAADVNADGKPDLICANLTANTLSVLTNNGSGGFVLASSPAVGSNPNWVTAADVNGDGRVDLISANNGANTLSVLTNNGSGGFVVASSPAVGTQPWSVTAADVNGDGKLDLITVNSGGGTLSVLTNSGGGGFVLASSLTANGTPLELTAADVNADGKVDLIYADYAFNTLWVLTNNGSGGFVLAASPGVGAGPVSVKAADVNGDGKVDLISANLNGNTLSVLTNNGSGRFALASSPAVGTSPQLVTAADVNGDGKVDLISANRDANTLSVLTNNGTGGFVLAVSPGVGSSPDSVAAADVNGDGKVDLVSANRAANTLSVLFNVANGYSGSFQGSFTGDGSRLNNLEAADLTGTVADARLSANVALLNSNQAFTGANRFAGLVTLTNAANAISGNGAGLTSLNANQLTTGTVPLALLPGAVVTNNETGLNLSGTFAGNGAGVTNVNLININSQGAMGWTTNWGRFVLASSPAAGNVPGAITTADVNSDGKVDVVVANHWDNLLTALTNNGSGGFALASSTAVGTQPNSVAAADINGDGKVDLISANAYGNTLSVLTNNGSGGFVLASSPAVGTQPYSVTAADINGDGKVDLISANSTANTLTVLTNDGSGGLVLASSPGVGTAPRWVTAADVNADGKVDLISANYAASTLSVLTNNGSGGFVLASSPGVGSHPESATAADVNGDGKLDLISVNYGANTLSVLTNNPDRIGSFVLASSPGVGAGPAAVAAADVNGDGKVDLISANSAANTVSVLLNGVSGYAASFQGSFTGDASGLQNLDAAELTGTVADARLSANVALLNANQAFTGANRFAGAVTLTNAANLVSGNGGGLTNLNAANLTGTVADARLSANVALLNGANVLTATNRFAGVLQATNLNNQLTGAFTGNGGGLTNLSGANLTGTVADARLSTNVALLNGTNVFTGTLYGSAPYLKYAEVTTNAAAGAAVAGTNNWREFNVELTDTHSLGSTNGTGDIILPAGTYQCRISAPAFRVQTHQIRLRTSTGDNLLFGTMGYSDESTGGSEDRSEIEGQFTLAASTTLRVQHRCTLARATDGLGALTGFDWGDANQTIFAVAQFWKIR